MARKRYFNTSGPNIPSRHYTLNRQGLIKRGMELVKEERYFTIWAPRQTGKSTYFRQLAEEYLIESKIYYYEKQFLDGKKQLAYYCNSLGLDKGVYLVFCPTGVNYPETVKEQKEIVDDVVIYTYLVEYDDNKWN